MENLMKYRELACYAVIWATASRGHDEIAFGFCRKLQLDDFRHPTDPWRAYNVQPFPLPESPQQTYPPGFHLVIA